jgi:hypothetical protein
MQKLPILKGTMTLLYTLVVSASHSARQQQYKLYHPRPKYKAQDLKTGLPERVLGTRMTWCPFDPS